MRTLLVIALIAVGLTASIAAPSFAGIMNGLNLANGMDINGVDATGGINPTGLSLSGVILPARVE